MPSSVYLLVACQAILMTGTSMVITASALVGAMLASDPVYATVPFGAQFLGMALVTYPASMTMARVGRRAGFLIGAGIGFAGAVAATVAIVGRSFELFVLGSFLVGAFNGVAQYYRFAAADVAPAGRSARAISWVVTGGIAAAFIGPNLARLTRDLWPGHLFAGVFATLTVLMVLSALTASMLRVPVASEARPSGPARSLAAIVTQRGYVVAALAATIGYGVMNLLMSATPLAMQAVGHAFGDTAYVIQWHIVAMFAPGFVTGHLISRYGVTRVMAAGVVALVLTVSVNLQGTGFWDFWVALVLLGIGWNFLFVAGTYQLTRSYEPQEKARAQGFNDLLVFGTVTLTAFSSGAIHYWAGWQSVNLGVLPFIGIIVAALGAMAFGRRPAPAAS